MSAKVLLVSWQGSQGGFGRIAGEVSFRLHDRGWNLYGISQYSDLWTPPMFGNREYPYYIAQCPNSDVQDYWKNVAKLANKIKPDIILDIGDFDCVANTYLAVKKEMSGYKYHPCKWATVTPVDGVPIYKHWVEIAKDYDSVITISKFGQEAFANHGLENVGVIYPGVNQEEFFRVNKFEQKKIRKKIGFPEDAFIVGTVAQNQARKCIYEMLEIFFRFSKDKPDVHGLFLTANVGGAVNNIDVLCQEKGWDRSKIKLRGELSGSLEDLNEAYQAMDVFMLLARREGFGMPILEAMRCGPITMAMDYCSGRELCGDGKGLLVRPNQYEVVTNWGHAMDKFPNTNHAVSLINDCYYDRPTMKRIANEGYKFASQYNWDMATEVVENELIRVLG